MGDEAGAGAGLTTSCARVSAISEGVARGAGMAEGLASARMGSVGIGPAPTRGESLGRGDSWLCRVGGDRMGERGVATCGDVAWMLRSSTGAGGSSRPRISFPIFANSVRHSANGCGFWTLPCPWLVVGDAPRPCSARATLPGTVAAAVGVRRSSVAGSDFAAALSCARWLTSESPSGVCGGAAVDDVACASESVRCGAAADGI